jgi:AhpC/TSA family
VSVLPAGTPAPSFTLARAAGESFSERDLQGRTTVLVFYPFAFTEGSKGIPERGQDLARGPVGRVSGPAGTR